MENNNLRIDPQGSSFLSDVAKWAYFLSILGFIGIGLMILIGAFMGTFMSRLPGMPGGSALPGTLMVIIYVFFGIIYFFPLYYLNRFAAKMKVALRNNDQETLNGSLRFLKAHYQYIGILTLIGVAIYAIALVAIIGVVGSARM